MVFSDEQQVVLTTILYSDIFDFPLTEAELWQYLLTDTPLTKKVCNHAVYTLLDDGLIIKRNGFFCLAGREETITKRQTYLPEVDTKMHMAKNVAKVLSAIPTIHFIGVSGGLSVGNVTQHDDIDFFIIAEKGTLFTTRLWILCLLEAKGLRRKRNTKNAANKICVNLLIDTTQLAWQGDRRDAYTAHEIAQLKPLFERDSTYKRFLQANRWIGQFLPNWSPDTQTILTRKQSNQWMRYLAKNPNLESFLQFLQKRYMKRHQTTEQVGNRFLAFHPNDYRSKTLSQLRSKSKQLGLLTKV